jgi:hypothetical protein
MSNNKDDGGNRSSTSRLVDSVDQMVRLPLEMTGATWDLMLQGMQSMTGGLQNATGQRSSGNRTDSSSSNRSAAATASSSDRSSASNWSSAFTGDDDQDLSGDDLKYVIWSIAFTKPGFECVIEPQHEEIVNYNADGASFAALKIAKFLERARHGHTPKPEAWGDTYPPPVTRTAGRKTETISVTPAPGAGVEANTGATAASSDRGWRIPAEDHKYITFLYRVDRRLAKQEAEVTRVERVTIERGASTKIV